MTRTRASWLAIAPSMFIVVFLVVPVVHVALSHLHSGDVIKVLNDSTSLSVVWFSLWQAIISTAATLMVGLPAAWVLSRFSFPGRTLVRGVLTAPFVMPAVVIAAGVLAILPEEHSHGVGPIIWAHVIFNVAVVIRVVSPRWSLTDVRLENAARMLGANGPRRFVQVVWPQIAGAVVNAASLVFVYCFTSFGIVSVLGGFRRRTMETEIFIQSVRLGDMSTATALAIVQAVIVVVVLVTARRPLAISDAPVGGPIPGALRDHPGRRWTVALVPAIVSAIVSAPLVATLARSVLSRGRFTTAGWRALGAGPLPGMSESALAVMATSFRFATLAAVVCVPLALVVVSRPRPILVALTSLPLVVSAATLGTGIIVTFDRDPFAWRSQTWLIPMVHAVIALPLIVRTLSPAHRAIPRSLRHAAAMLGASPLQTWSRIDLRILRPALARSFGLAMAVSLGEFGATSFLSRSGSTTMPIAIARLLGRPGDVPSTAGFALSSVMVITTIGVMSRA